MPDDDDRLVEPIDAAEGFHHVVDEGMPGGLVKDFGDLRAEALPEAGGEDYRGKRGGLQIFGEVIGVIALIVSAPAERLERSLGHPKCPVLPLHYAGSTQYATHHPVMLCSRVAQRSRRTSRRFAGIGRCFFLRSHRDIRSSPSPCSSGRSWDCGA